MDQEAGEPMSENKKSLAGAGTPNQAEETTATDNDQKFSLPHNSTRQEQEQAGFLSTILPHGKSNAIPGRELVKLLELKDLRELTQMVERERAEGAPICASTGSLAPGYYLADDPAELEQYIHSLDRRLHNMGQTRKHLGTTLDGLTGRR